MGLNPGDNALTKALRVKVLDDNFNDGSPYYGMYHCGYYGVPFEDCVAKCKRNGIALRSKDIRSYNEGLAKRGMVNLTMNGLPNVKPSQGMAIKDAKLGDFPKLPIGWVPPERRFFPCTSDNRPMQKWGWKKNDDGSVFAPELYLKVDARALSPCGWVGQNMLYQRFIVLDIDGRGHGADDHEVIAFGNQFRDTTFTMEDPAKPGSFHLYFETDRLIPVCHFPWAKLDLMGNAVNAAVYLKTKRSNGLPLRILDDEVWQAMMAYQIGRKEN